MPKLPRWQGFFLFVEFVSAVAWAFLSLFSYKKTPKLTRWQGLRGRVFLYLLVQRNAPAKALTADSGCPLFQHFSFKNRQPRSLSSSVENNCRKVMVCFGGCRFSSKIGDLARNRRNPSRTKLQVLKIVKFNGKWWGSSFPEAGIILWPLVPRKMWEFRGRSYPDPQMPRK